MDQVSMGKLGDAELYPAKCYCSVEYDDPLKPFPKASLLNGIPNEYRFYGRR
jgi:hypothetical protein